MKITIGDIQDMDNKELRMLNKLVVAELKARQAEKINGVKEQLSVGQTVGVDHRKLFGVECTITKINRKRVTVDSNRGSFTVPMSMLIIE